VQAENANRRGSKRHQFMHLVNTFIHAPYS
jgi:hypothetical protein